METCGHLRVFVRRQKRSDVSRAENAKARRFSLWDGLCSDVSKAMKSNKPSPTITCFVDSKNEIASYVAMTDFLILGQRSQRRGELLLGMVFALINLCNSDL